MIGSLRGVLVDRYPKGDAVGEVLVDVGGVGYRVVVPARASRDLGDLGGDVFVHIHTHVREDALVLYGFVTRDERNCFEVLIGTHGVGPAVALAMLSIHTPAALAHAVANDDADALMLVPGIGAKTAARLLIELKARLDPNLGSGETYMAEHSGLANGTAGSSSGSRTPRSDVRIALAGLGYTIEEVREVLAELPAEGSAEVLLRLALRQLAVAR